MHPEPRHVVDLLVPHLHPAADVAAAFAPANIALCKYWGKRNEKLKLPLTGSLSVSLGTLGTRMRIEIADRDCLCINGEEQDPEGKAFRRLFEFMDLFRNPGAGFSIESENTIPMGAGLASSASAFAAAVSALDKLYGWNLDLRQQSILARMGSGSASRSLSPGFVEWFAGEREDGMDSYAEALEWVWLGFRVGILTLSRAEKSVSSGAGMRRTMENSVLYSAWPRQVAQDLPRIRQAIQEKDFPLLGKTAEQNAMAMHATMIAAWPPLIYWLPESVATLRKIQSLREDGCEVYATMDAGPNVKLLFTRETESQVQNHFPDIQIVKPFAEDGPES